MRLELRLHQWWCRPIAIDADVVGSLKVGWVGELTEGQAVSSVSCGCFACSDSIWLMFLWTYWLMASCEIRLDWVITLLFDETAGDRFNETFSGSFVLTLCSLKTHSKMWIVLVEPTLLNQEVPEVKDKVFHVSGTCSFDGRSIQCANPLIKLCLHDKVSQKETHLDQETGQPEMDLILQCREGMTCCSNKIKQWCDRTG